MGRPKKCRKVCQLPNTKEFLPVGTDDCTTAIVLTVDEFETLRLIDLQDLSQEECGANMQVARTTVQSIYGSARKKLAQALVEGRPIRIEGGDYQLCDGSSGVCGCSACHKHHLHCQREASTIAIHPCDNLEEDLQ